MDVLVISPKFNFHSYVYSQLYAYTGYCLYLLLIVNKSHT